MNILHLAAACYHFWSRAPKGREAQAHHAGFHQPQDAPSLPGGRGED